MNHQFARLAGLVTVLGMCTSPASAHHVADNRLPSTLIEGLLSGLAHPVIGLDHLAFVVAVAIAATLLAGGWRVVATFFAVAGIGAVIHLLQLTLPLVEVLVALSLVVAGASILANKVDHLRLWMLLAGAAGLVHGYALTESIIGATPAVTAAYFVGLSTGVLLLIIAIRALAQRVLSPMDTNLLPMRAAGAVVAAVGLVFVTSALIGA